MLLEEGEDAVVVGIFLSGDLLSPRDLLRSRGFVVAAATTQESSFETRVAHSSLCQEM